MTDTMPDGNAPKLQLEADMGDSGLPPHNTAIGQMEPDSGELLSWPMPNLQFLQLRDSQTSRRKGSPPSIEGQPAQVEDLLIALHSRKANMGFLLLGGPLNRTFNIGISDPVSMGAGSAPAAVLQTLMENIFATDLKGLGNQDDETIKSLIIPLCNYSGLITSNQTTSIEDFEEHRDNIMQRLSTALGEKHFGLLILAIPIPNAKVAREEYTVSDQLSRAQDPTANASPVDETFLKVTTDYFSRLQLGTRVGMWLTGIYYFAKSRDVMTLIESTLGQKGFEHLTLERPVGLTRHILTLGLLRNKQSVIQELLEYRYLTPLNSRDLADMVHLPL